MAEKNNSGAMTVQEAGRQGGEKVKRLVEEGKESEVGLKGGESFGGPHKRAGMHVQHATAKSHKNR